MSEKLTPKDYLMQIRKLRVLIDQREKELDRLREQTFSSVSGIDYSRIPVKGSRRVGASFEQAANKALDLTGEVAGLIDEYNDLRHKSSAKFSPSTARNICRCFTSAMWRKSIGRKFP